MSEPIPTNMTPTSHAVIRQDVPKPRPAPVAAMPVRHSSRVEQPDVARMLHGLRVHRASQPR